jgi:hypothetical protein
VESVAAIHNDAAQRDELWVCVRRRAPYPGYDLAVADDAAAPGAGAPGQTFTLPAGRTFGPGHVLLAAHADGARHYLYQGDTTLAAPADADLTVTLSAADPAEFADAEIEAVRAADGALADAWQELEPGTPERDVRCIEFLEAEFGGADTTSAFFVDSGLSYEGAATDVVAGLDHLAGREVAVLADGAVHKPVTVGPDGALTLTRAASVIHAGLPYTSVLKPMRIEAGSARGTAQTKKKLVTEVAVRFHDTVGGRVGPDANRLETVYYRSSATPMNTAPTPWTGDKIVRFPKGWDRDGALTILQDQPLPMTVLMLVPTVVVNE